MVQSSKRSFFVSNRNTLTKYGKWLLCFCFGASIAFFSRWAQADVLFEGYSKVLSGGVHVGYIVNRYEFDNKKKQFISTSFLKTNELAGNLSESLKAYATDDLKPISYQYTTIIGKETKTIDAKYENGKISAIIKDGPGKTEKVLKEVPKGAFLSTFLAYTILRSPQGFKADTKYDYNAIAEEDAAVAKGIAIVKNQEDFNGFKAYKVLNEFKSAKFYSWVSEKGEVFSTKSPAQGISTELVAQPSQATGSFPIPTSILKTLFGDVPTGQKNQVSEKAKADPDPATTNTTIKKSAKEEGIPQGKGIMVKGK